MDISSSCRICLGKEDVSNIFKDTTTISVSAKIMCCASVQIYKGDGLPELICNICLDNLNKAYDFKQKCEKTDSFLRECNKNTNNETPVADIEFTQVKCEFPEFELFASQDSESTYKNDNEESCVLLSNCNTLSSQNKIKLEKVMKEDKLNNIKLLFVKEKCIEDKLKSKKTTLCETCGRVFRRSTTLARHMRRHTGERPHVCQCGRSFFEASHLRRHRAIHTGLKQFKCELCPKVFSDSSNVKKHIRAVHDVEKNVKCTQCPKKFILMSALTVHMRIHTGERPYSCTICPQKFAHSNSLKRHIRIHTGERPYCCSHCGASFNDGGNFRAHMRLHTGETPYKCYICNKGYAQSSNLKSHMTRIHKKKL